MNDHTVNYNTLTYKKGSISIICMLLLLGFPFFVKAQQAEYSWQNLPKAEEPSFPADTLNIVSFGAVADGSTLNTEAINKAIEACSAKGGGVVLIPDGFWMTGPIRLKSYVNLYLAKNAVLQFTKDFDQYKLIEGVYEGKPSARNESPISGSNLENIAITGSGVIDGNGDAWRMVFRSQLTESEWKEKVASGGLVSGDGNTWFPSEKTKKAHEEGRSMVLTGDASLSDFEDIKDYLRPNLIVLTQCKKVLLEGVTFQNSPAWNLHPLLCEDVTLRNLMIKNPDYAHNGDGVDPESCKNVVIEGCVFDVGDDAICIKSGKDEEGRKRGVPTENVYIRDNVVYKGHGGFVVGSEMSGGARNIFVEDCSFIGTDKGVRFKTTRGRGGVVERIYIRNILMADIKDEAIFFDMYYWIQPPAKNQKVEIPEVTEETPKFRDITLENIICNGAEMGIFIRGLPEMPIQGLVLQNLKLTSNIGAEIKDGKDILLEHVNLSVDKSPLIYIESSEDIVLNDITYGNKIKLLLDINGIKSNDIYLKNSEISEDMEVAVFKNGASENILKVN